jgi:hypothetical protein
MNNHCFSCKDFSNCINIQSPDGSIIVTRENTYNGTTFTLKANNSGGGTDFPFYLTFNNTDRTLCVRGVGGQPLSCITLPTDEPQQLTLNGSTLTISDGNSVSIPVQLPISVTSNTLSHNQSGSMGEQISLEIVPSNDAQNILRFGTDGRLYVPYTKAQLSTDYYNLTTEGTDGGIYTNYATVKASLLNDTDFLDSLDISVTQQWAQIAW